MRRPSAAMRHLLLTSALAASTASTIIWMSHLSVTVEVPWWRRDVTAPPANASVRHQQAAAARSTLRFPGPERGMLWLWLLGTGVAAIGVARQAAAVRGIRRRSPRVTDALVTHRFGQARSCVPFDGPVDLRMSPEIDVPCVTGLVRPAILVPSTAAEWTSAEARSVFAHELAHLARRDLWTRAIAHAACAIQWFNPLVWWLASAADQEAERAADDHAIRSGIRPSAYADTLLAFAAHLSNPARADMLLAFARRSSLERRVLAVLDPAGNRRVLRGSACLAVIVGVTVLIATVGCVRLAPHSEPALAGAPTGAPAPAPRADATTLLATVAAAEVAPRRFTRPAAAPLRASASDWIDNAVKGLVDVLDDASPQVRAAAASSLRQFDDPKGRAAVDRALALVSRTRASIERIEKDGK